MTPENLYLANEKLVFHVIKRYFTSMMHDEDVEQIGRLGLWKACQTYNSDESKFTTYACNCIRNTIAMELRKSMATKRNSQDYILISLDQELKTSDIEDMTVAEVIPGDMDVGFVDWDGFWNSLTKRERLVLLTYAKCKNKTEVVKKLGISHTTIWRCVTSIRKKWNAYI